MQKSNLYSITGVIFSMRVQPWTKKEGEFKFIRLETTRPYIYTDAAGLESTGQAKNFPEFKLRMNLDWEGFKEGQEVKIHFTPKGEERKWKDKVTQEEKKRFFDENEVLYLERVFKDAELPIEDNSFPTPNPYDDEADKTDLPF